MADLAPVFEKASPIMVPPARYFEKGSTVLVLGDGEARALGAGFALWAVVLFGAGYLVGARKPKKGRR